LAARGPMSAAALAEPALLASYLSPGYVPQAHHRLMSARLRVWADTPDARLLVTLPPQVGKSFTSVVWCAFWLLCRDPTKRVIIACCNATLAREHGEKIRDLITEYGAEFGLRLRRGKSPKMFFHTDAGGYVRLVGRGGATTGLSADVFLVDDPLQDYAEALSPTIKEKTWLWLGAVVHTRLQHGAPMMMSCTRWALDDPPGRFLKDNPGVWEAVSIPALSTGDDDPLGRPAGAPLPRPGVDEHDTDTLIADWHRIRREVPEVIWTTMYQCDPKPPGASFITATEILASLHEPPEVQPHVRAVSVDPTVWEKAQRERRADPDTCGILAGFIGEDERVYLTHDRTAVLSASTWPAVVARLAAETGAQIVYIEGNQGGGLLSAPVAAAWKKLVKAGEITGRPPTIEVTNTSAPKATRAMILAGLIKSDHVRLGARLPEFVAEASTWQVGAPSPGRLDAAGHLALHLLPSDVIAPGRVASVVGRSKEAIAAESIVKPVGVVRIQRPGPA
ncbi:MAG: hypothetical protein ACRD0P_21030, partial [Stackebrandtia sp.]